MDAYTLAWLLGLPFIVYFTGYATGKNLALLGGLYEPLPLPASGRLEPLQEHTGGRLPRVLVVVPSYNDESVVEALPKWLGQSYPEYRIVVAEDGGVGYEFLGKLLWRREYTVALPDGATREVAVEAIGVSERPYEVLVVRRGDRRGYKPGALNNVIALVEEGILSEALGGFKPDYAMIVDADHEPGRNPWLRWVLLGKRHLDNKPLTPHDYEALRWKLERLEPLAREVLDVDSYVLDPREMDSPSTLITRAVELFEYHRKLLPGLAVVQGYQSHYAPHNRGLDLLVQASHILAQWALSIRSPRVRLILRGADGDKRALESPFSPLPARLLAKLTRPRLRIAGRMLGRGTTVEVHYSNHWFPLFTGSSGIIDWRLLAEYMFADGVYMRHHSLTEDWELSIRLQRDKYLIVATHQLETWGRPPRSEDAYKRQQYRWAYGTTKDIKFHIKSIINSNLIITEKLGFLAQITHYLGGPIAPLAMSLGAVESAFFKEFTQPLYYILLFYFAFTSFVVEGLITGKASTIRGTIKKFFKLIPIYSYGIFDALTGKSSGWTVTRKERVMLRKPLSV